MKVQLKGTYVEGDEAGYIGVTVTTRIVPVLLIVTLLVSVGYAREGQYSNASVAGTYKCRISVFAWPRKADEPLMPNSAGTAEIVADGAGKLTSGSQTLHATWTEEGKPCVFNLDRGRYSINADGSARFDGEWKRWEGGNSGFKCFNIVHPFRDWYLPPTITNTLVSDSGARTYTTVYDRSGISIYVCDRDK